MSDLTRDVLKDFADIVIDESNKDEEVTAYGTTVESDGVDYVKLDGSSLLTPITTTTDIKPGERVLVLIKNHQAVIIGNSSNPSAGSQELNNLKETVNLDKATIKDLVANNVTINDSLKANSARIDSLEATNVEINGKLTADRADITRLDTEKLNADEADIRYAKVDELRATSADVVKLNADYAKFKDASVKRLDANEASIQDLDAKKLSAEAADIKYLTIDNAKATYLQAGDFNAYKATVETLLAAKASIKELESNYLKVNRAEATYAKITELDALTGNFNTLNADLAKVEELVAKKASVEDLNAANASIQTLQTDLATANQLIAKKVDAKYVDSEIVKATETITDDLTAIHAIVDVLDTKYATIKQLNAAKANLETLIAKKATIEDLKAAKATIGELNGLVANINSILSGSIGTGTLQTIHLTAENVVIDDAIIKSANIKGLDVSKLNAGTISTNKFAIKSDDGGIVISGSTQQFKDKNNKVRLQIGKDAKGNFNFIVFGENGSTAIYNQNGITKQAVPDGLIVDQMVSDTANIQANKIQYIDKDGNKTLQTVIKQEQGKINELIKETTIENSDGTNSSLKDKYLDTVKTVDGMKTTIADVETKQDAMSSKITEIETSTKGIKTSVTKAQTTADSAKTTAEQTASKFSWLVKSGTSATDFTLTDRTAQLVANNINLNGLVTFNGLDSSTQNKINNANSKIDNLKIGGRNLFLETKKHVAYSAYKSKMLNGFQIIYKSCFESMTDIYPIQSEDLIPKVGQIYTIQMMVRGRIYGEYTYDKSRYDLSKYDLFDVKTIEYNTSDGIYNFKLTPKEYFDNYSPKQLDSWDNLKDGTTHKVNTIERLVCRYNNSLYDLYMIVLEANGKTITKCYPVLIGKQNSGCIAQYWYPNVYGNNHSDSQSFIYPTEDWKLHSHQWSPSSSLDSETKHSMILARLSISLGIGTIEIYAPKFEIGNKATDWTPAPEDKADQSIIDNWANDSVVNGETVINGGYIKTNTIKTDQLAVDDIFATGSAAMNIINAQEINANRITSGLLSAERINAYGLSILNKTTNQQTFNISNNGEVTIRGSVSSSNYNIGKTGWTINNDGAAEFNDIVARGSVITNDGGIVSSGGTGRNLLRNTNFSNQLQLWNPNSTTLVSDNDFRYVAKITSSKAATGIYQSPIRTLIKGNKYTLSCYAKSNVQTKVALALNDNNINSAQFINIGTSWVKVCATFTNNDINVNPRICSGENKSVNIYIANIKFEEGDIATEWSPAPEDKLKQVRFWAGSTYSERESAPWIVYSDGSMKATQGEFSGVFSGTVDIGNIKIADPSSTAGGDALLTIQNGQNGIKRVQLTDSSASRFAQDIIIADDHDADKISLKQDGTAVIGTGINVGNNIIINGKSLIMNNNELTTTDDGVSYLFKSHVTLGTSVGPANLIVNGNANMNDVTVNEHLYFGSNVKITKVSNGVNIDVIN